jgi:hypothetical protein
MQQVVVKLTPVRLLSPWFCNSAINFHKMSHFFTVRDQTAEFSPSFMGISAFP